VVNARFIKLLVALGFPLLLLLIPTDWLPIADLTIIQHRLLAIFLMAALLWVLEPVPVFSTSLLIITLQLIMISDKGLHWFRGITPHHPRGELIPYTDILSAFSSPIIILFMGGFSLAIAASNHAGADVDHGGIFNVYVQYRDNCHDVGPISAHYQCATQRRSVN
jgi:sodium-dependent dicarboxylate transporter 2/3/5